MKEARERRDQARRTLAHGVDPSAERQAEAERARQALITFRMVAEEWLALRTDSMAAVTYNKAKWMLQSFAYPHLGEREFASIQPPDVLLAIRAVEARGLSETAHRVKARISARKLAIGAQRHLMRCAIL